MKNNEVRRNREKIKKKKHGISISKQKMDSCILRYIVFTTLVTLKNLVIKP